MRTLSRGSVAIAIGIIIVTGCSQRHGDMAVVESAPPVEIPDTLAEVARRYSITIEPLTKPIRWHYWFCADRHADPPTAKQIQGYAPLLVAELNRYPKSFFEQIKLERIVLCGSMRRGVANSCGCIDGFAVARSNTIYLDTRYDADNRKYDWCPKVVHHELFHILDARNDDAFDAEWKALNPASFRYGHSPKQQKCSCAERGGEGFLAADGTSNMGEDKAHYFAFMVKHYTAVRDLAKRDPIVGAKADLMEKIVADSCPEIVGDFWAEAQRRSGSVEERTLAAVRYQWCEQKPGVDPLHPDQQTDPPFTLVRRTAFPGCHGYWSSAGRLTHLNTSWKFLVRYLYNTRALRCDAAKELQDSHFDLIVSLQPNGKDQHDPRIGDEARKAFESAFMVTVEKEAREIDVYVVRLGSERTRLLEKAAKRLEREQATAKRKQFWRQLFGDGQNKDPHSEHSSMAGTQMYRGQPQFFIQNMSLAFALEIMEFFGLDRPVIDETGFSRAISVAVEHVEDSGRQLQILADALGLQIIPARRTIEMTVFKKRPDES